MEFYINGLVQYCSNSIALAVELLQSCIKPLTQNMPQIMLIIEHDSWILRRMLPMCTTNI